MNTKVINFSITLVLAVAFSFFLPWWSVMIAGFITALVFPLKRSAVFFVPFIAIMLFWIIYAFITSQSNDFILAKKIAVLLSLNGNAYLLMLVTGVVGGLAAGIAGIFGKQCRLVFSK